MQADNRPNWQVIPGEAAIGAVHRAIAAAAAASIAAPNIIGNVQRRVAIAAASIAAAIVIGNCQRCVHKLVLRHS